MSGWILKKLSFILIFTLFTTILFELFFRFIPINLSDRLASYLNPFYIFSNLTIIVFILILASLIATTFIYSVIFRKEKRKRKDV